MKRPADTPLTDASNGSATKSDETNDMKNAFVRDRRHSPSPVDAAFVRGMTELTVSKSKV